MGCVPTHVSVVGRFKAVVTEVVEFDTVGKYGFKLLWDFPFDFFSFPFYLRSFPKFAGSENWHSPHIYIFFLAYAEGGYCAFSPCAACTCFTRD